MPTGTTSPSRSRSRSRLRAGPYPPIGVAHLEGQVDDASAELLHEFVHSHPHSPVEELAPDPAGYEVGGLEVDKVALEVQRLERDARPWWRRPSATW
jgi:hypothetical protein